MTDAPARAVILLCEDDDLVAHVIRRTLRNGGFDVQHVEHGEAALDALSSAAGSFAAVLLDYTLPGDLSGLDTLERMRAQGHTMPVVLSSGHEAESLPRRAHELATDFLQKPFRGAELLDVVRRALARND